MPISTMAQEVPLLEKNERLLQRICGFLKPVYYNEQSYIVREGEPLDATLFITQGIVWSFTTGNNGEGIDSSEAECIGKVSNWRTVASALRAARQRRH
uniref:Cyclic nucleotide-binding domain-containing protein n=1 Tax=Quercus lobata TaxID=97700 RepID=A0A7N2MHK3_QUELO